MKNITKIALAWELSKQGGAKVRVAENLNIGRATLYRWLNGIKEEGDLEAFIDGYLAAKKRSSIISKKITGFLWEQPPSTRS